MPARKNPVKNRKLISEVKLFSSSTVPKLQRAPNRALTRKTFEGEKRSAMLNKANKSVPIINPNCTAEVR